MTNIDSTDVSQRSGGSGLAWLYLPLVLILFLGGALAVGAYFYGEPQLTIAEALAAGFGGVAALIVGLFAAAIGIVVGLFGALIGLVAAGGAVGMTLFVVASPVIAIILLVMLMRRPRANPQGCPDPSAHE